MKKVLIALLAVIVLFITALVAIPFFFKDEINATVKLEINKNLNAKVDYGDFDLSLIRSFPNFSFSINDVSVVGINEFSGDTLAYIKNFNFTLDLMTVLKGEKYKILAVILNDATIQAVVNKDGKANWDIVKPSDEKTPENAEKTAFSLEIKKYEINNATIVYDDQQGKTFASINDLDFSGSGDVSSDVYDFITTTAIAALTVKSGAVTYLKDAKIKADNRISVDTKNNKYAFAKNEIDVNDLGLLFDGFVQIADKDISLDVKFGSKEATFKSILSLIPAIYKKDFEQVKTAGTLALKGSAKGVYNETTYPSLDLNLTIGNAMFQYPSLPTAVNNININANVSKEQGSLDKMFVNISKLHAEIGSDPIDGKITVITPISDPNVDLTLKGKLNLADVPKFYPMEDLKTISGLLVADLSFKGRQSDIEKKRYDAVKAAGTLSISNLIYDSKETPMPVNISAVQMSFNPKNITVGKFAAKIGKSDFDATGSLDNYIAYLFNNGALHGNLNLSSNVLNVTEFLSKDTTAKTAATPTAESEKYFQVPANIDFALKASFGKIFYDKLELDNAKGNVSVKDETISLNNIYAELLGGNATIDATYSTAKSTTPKVTFAYDIKNFDFQKTYQYVDMAPKLAPIIKYVQGTFSSDLTGSGSLNEDMSVDYNSLNGEGKVSIPSAKIVNLPILQKIAEVTKVQALQNLSLNNAWTSLKFKDGKVAVEPTDIKFGNGYNVKLQGQNGFDETIDYDVQFDVPSKELGGATSFLTSKIPNVGGLVKAPETLSLFLKVGGTASKPTVKLQKVGIGGSSSVGDIAKNALNEAKDKAIEAAKQQAEALKEQAEQQAKAAAEQAKQAAQKAADDAKKKADEAAQKAKEAADKAAKDAENKAKNAVKGLFGK